MVDRGSRLGPYEVLSLLGAGGMGEVWQGRDTRLNRQVAIKILPADVAQNEQFKVRFAREAKAISQLNHPHICTLYDVGENYLVMELLEGESLADRIKRGPLPLDDALQYGVQIAEAMDKAHRAGIVHRDLKPANVMITKWGAKLLDFGLAKPVLTQGPHSQTITAQRPVTEEGHVVGTLQYMGPEQLAGEPADARSDIFSFGTILYEMVTGNRAFEGTTRSALVAAIVGAEPQPLSEIRPLTPLALQHVIAKCLSKDPDERWQSAHDIAEELEWIQEVGSKDVVPARRGVWPERFAWLALVALVAASAILYFRGRPNERRDVARFTINLPAGVVLSRAVAPHQAISRDGKMIAFTVKVGNTTDLYVRPANAFEARRIPGAAGASGIFFSADGKSIGFNQDSMMRKVFLDGDSLSTICPAVFLTGADWGEDGTIIFAPDYRSGIARVSASGGTTRMLTQVDHQKHESSHGWPQFLPGQQWMIFTIENSATPFDDATIVAQSLVSGERKVLIEGGTHGRYVPTGHLLYGRTNALYAVPFDAKRVRLTGPAVQVLPNVFIDPARGALHFSVSDTGLAVYTPGPARPPQTELFVVERTGAEVARTRPLSRAVTLGVSPDGRRVVFERSTSDDDIWVYDFDRDVETRVAFRGENVTPTWTADGSHIVFASDRSGALNLYDVAADGTGETKRLTNSPNDQVASSTARDGTIVYMERRVETGWDLWLLPPNGTPRPFLVEPGDQYQGAISRDGKWLAYSSNGSGRTEVFVRALKGPQQWQLSTAGGSDPRWSKDSQELGLVRDASRIVVPVVGSVRGAFDSFFRTSLKLENLWNEAISGTITFRATRSDVTKSIRYELAAHAYTLYPDLLAALATDGIGSLEITPDRVESGTIPAPIVDARLLSAGNQGGSFGATIPAVAFGDDVLGASWPVLATAQFRIGNTAQRRYNLGLRVMGDEVHLTARLLSSDGTQKALVERTLPPNWHEQVSAGDFFGQPLSSGDVVDIVALRENGMVRGGAIIYLAETDNITADVDLIVARSPRMWLTEPMIVCSAGCTLLPR
jgi:eukaryotic-like serine/threonine-protein kinase